MLRLPDLTRWLLLPLFVVALSAPAQAGPRDHDGGFFLRLSGGFGGASTQIDESNLGKLKFKGASGDFNFAIGGGIAKNLMLHGTIWGWALSDPDVESDSLSGQAQGDITLGAAGGGITYYLMPANVYFSASVGLGSLDLDGYETDVGIVLDGTIGKEWWVGDKWGLGLSVGVSYHSVSDKNVDLSWSGPGIGVRFSATMN